MLSCHLEAVRVVFGLSTDGCCFSRLYKNREIDIDPRSHTPIIFPIGYSIAARGTIGTDYR